MHFGPHKPVSKPLSPKSFVYVTNCLQQYNWGKKGKKESFRDNIYLDAFVLYCFPKRYWYVYNV